MQIDGTYGLVRWSLSIQGQSEQIEEVGQRGQMNSLTDKKEAKQDYSGGGTLLTGKKGGDKQEKAVLTPEKPKKKSNTVAKKKTQIQKIVQYV